jgi:transcriptional regulator with XRE-family HTH domain
MGQDQGAGGTAVAGPRDPEQIRDEIEQTRHKLGDTVEALAAKTNVRAQMQRKLEQAKQNPLPFAAILGTVVAALIVRQVVRS